ncbi:YitT family protein [Paenactinomyces guangxiensis]|uniref:YitT family protein n=1 Tax=Paenactinomyces guangxiensis TaxID=1490290 RepID=A0A7W2A8C7_9BACL|nr:YitT family protein [Paenactinomyces guangxiensis]MBH8590970.1 YitT family protein [Paenactinomyces guangxiensis]
MLTCQRRVWCFFLTIGWGGEPVNNVIVIFLASVLVAFAYNMFLLPHNILSSGVSGIAMMIGLKTPLNTGVVNLVLNLPLFIIGFMKLGKRFMINTLFSVAVTSVALILIPISPISKDPILSSVFGGVLAGIAGGLIFRFSASAGGFDIIGLLLTRKKEFPLGNLLFMMNSAVIFVSGFLFSWDAALYTMLSMFATGKVIDTIHTRHLKVTLMIVTSQGDEIKNALFSKLVRGITVVDGEGAYTKEKRKVLFTTISRYELAEVKRLIKEADPKAFVNITETIEVLGYFRRE